LSYGDGVWGSLWKSVTGVAAPAPRVSALSPMRTFPSPADIPTQDRRTIEVAAPGAPPISVPPWIDLPPGGQPYTKMNTASVVIPAIASEVSVVNFMVPAGRHGVIHKISNVLIGGGWTEGTGDLVWRLEVDGLPVPGFNSVIASLGSLSNPADFGKDPIRIREGQFINLVLRNVAVAASGQQLIGMIRGYFYPISQELGSPWL